MFIIPSTLLELSKIFSNNNFEISLVGGSVRDYFLNNNIEDFDLTTDAKPDDIIKITNKWADKLWLSGKEFGTIGIIKNGIKIEVTTYRSDKYNSNSRKPVVLFGDSLEKDLSRRDFTINSIAIRLNNSENELVDPFNGKADIINNKVIKTPINPDDSFSDDPLRMIRAFRFLSTLDFVLDESVLKSVSKNAEKIKIVSNERICDEFSKLILGKNPSKAIDEMVYSGLCDYIIPEIPNLKIDTKNLHKDIYKHSLDVLQTGIKLESDYFDAPDLTLRLALLLHDIGKVKTRKIHNNGTVTFLNHANVGAKMAYKRLKELKFPQNICRDVAKLTELHLRFYGYADSAWTDSAVRRYAIDAGHLLNHLHVLTKADNTSKNENKLKRLQFAYEDLENRLKVIAEKEELSKIRPELNGDEIMELLDLKAGPTVGKAYNFLLEYRIENGEVGKVQIIKVLKKWAKDNKIG